MECKDPQAVDLDQALPRRDDRPADMLALVEGTHRTTVSFGTIEPPGSDAFDGEALEIDIAGSGDARYFANCGLLELDVRVSLQSESGSMQIEAPGTVSAYGADPPSVTAEFSQEELGDWAAALARTVDQAGDNHLRIQMTFHRDAVAGRFSVVDAAPRRYGLCVLARWPAGSRCETYERTVPAAEHYHGLRADYLIDALHELPAPTLDWPDGSSTPLAIEFELEGDTACVREQSDRCDDNCDGRVQYSVPGRMRLSTDDGRLDVTVPARVDTVGMQAAWRELRLSTDGQVVAKAVEHAPFDGLDPSKAVVVRFGGSNIYSASLELWTLTPNPGVTMPSPACTTNGYVGPLAGLTTATTH